jgi:hypothetical protein
LGTKNLSNILGGQRRHSTKFIIHDDYNGLTFDNDVALIYLDEEVLVIDNSSVAILSSRDYRSYSNFTCVVPDWGLLLQIKDLNDILLGNPLNIIDTEKCSLFFEEIDKTKICAWGSTAPCHGNSGAPLLCGNEQVGIVSGAPQFCSWSTLRVYTNVFYYKNWIQQEIENYLRDNGLSSKKYPSIVFINSIFANETQNCVGTLIDKNFILTGAHCVHG